MGLGAVLLFCVVWVVVLYSVIVVLLFGGRAGVRVGGLLGAIGLCGGDLFNRSELEFGLF